jgi:4-hydroxy-tetrahydrodipicolinate synthase
MSAPRRDLGRLLTAMVTPFDAAGQVDHARMALLARRLVADGSDGLVVSGTTGESPTLTRDEKLALFKTVKEAVGDSATVVAGTGSNSTAETIALSQDAEAVGVDGLLVIAPYYNKPNQAGLRAHFEAVAAASHLPVVLYNHPGRTGVTIEASTLEALAQVTNIVAIKDSSGSLELVTAFRLHTSEDFLIYSGDDPLTLQYLATGAHGVISVTSHVAGTQVKAMIEAWLRGDHHEALRLHLALYDLSKVLFCAPSPGPTKAALAMQGFPVGGVRLPLVDLTDTEYAQVRRVLDASVAVRV